MNSISNTNINWKKRNATCGDFSQSSGLFRVASPLLAETLNEKFVTAENLNIPVETETGIAKTPFILNGWVHNVRDMGGLIFIDLRDRYGLMQLVIEPENTPELAEKAKALKSEYVIWAEGTLRLRSNPNPKLPSGYMELLLQDFGIINKSELPPFEITDELDTNEELKLRYRYLDLRRHSLQRNFIVRNKVYQIMHQYFAEHNFLEVETPVLMKSTPEGARDFLVPSRIHKGQFYALPQSPQIYKQILMMSGFDRYVQIVKCFRDEDLRSDRQPEFTQLDLEMSFVEQDDILTLIEGLFRRLWKEILNVELPQKFPRMSYEEAMTRFGSDKPDIRFEMEIINISEVVEGSEFKVFQDALAINNNQNGARKTGAVCAINAKGAANYSRKQLDSLTDFAKKYGAKGLAYIKLLPNEISSPIAKFLTEEEMAGIKSAVSAKEGDLVLIISDEKYRALTILGALRLEMAKQLGIIDKLKNTFSFHFVVDFPLFEYDVEAARYVAMHHPFTSPKAEDVPLLDTAPGEARANAYDLVLNGSEVGGGSIRIHNTDLQSKMFGLLGLSEKQTEDKFGYLLKALKFGAPPHGGIALGVDRITMLLVGTDNIRDVIAFPKTTSGMSLMDGCPSGVDDAQLKELGIGVLASEK